MKLTPKQERFVQEYLVDLNATAAAKRAGYSAKNADKIGSELLGKTRVSQAIQNAMQDRVARTEVTQDYVIGKLKEITDMPASDAQEVEDPDLSAPPHESEDNGQELPPAGDGDGQGDGTDQPQEPPTGGSDDQQPPTQEPSDGKDTGTGTETSQEPSGSLSGGDKDNGHDYTPPAHWWPPASFTPSIGHTATETPTDDAPLENTPRLVCGNAVIDTSRMIVLLGYGDGQPHRDDLLTRAQTAQIIHRLLTAESAAQLYTLQNSFTDVPAAAWYAEAVSTIANAGVVVGCGNGLFCPDDNLTWAQALTILARFVEPQEYELQHISYNGWALDSIQTAVALGWIRDSAEIVPDALITRGQMADLVNLVLELSR